MPQTRRVTLKMIAQKAGTSIGTVDRALKNGQGIRQATKERVLRAAKELGYSTSPFSNVPLHAGPVRLGMVYPVEPEAFFGPVTTGMNDAAADLRALGVEVVPIRFANHRQDMEEEALEKLRAGDFQGLAVNSAGPRIQKYIDRFSQGGLPVITFNTDAPDSLRRFFVGNSSLQAGHIGAAMIGRARGGKGTATVLGNFMQAQPFSDRFSAFCDMLHRRYPQITLYPCMECCAQWQIASQNLMALLRA
ncbi:MAG: substrate-binding domain-containing protein, partial [Eubacteriales bacterium]|nr:substrate-binding domain-containing protein [Eubacteriales bacterium]